MKFILSQDHTFKSDGFSGWGYNTAEDFSNASVVYMEITKDHFKMKNTGSDRIYYVIDGTGSFTVDDETTGISKTDVVIIPKNTPYSFKASTDQTLKLLLVDTPAYHNEDDVKL
jgi:mannose-6-phosphate isomerase-like protein (cupin superfamily)